VINKKIIVLGNGPSLKSVDLKSLSSVDTIGMNAAYRYWERVDWYPTHYVCLDDQLIETHASAINDLIVKGKVRTAFLISKILDYYPELVSNPKVYFLESFNATRQKRVDERGIPFISTIPFRESDASKVTTGAYSVRFAAFLGYSEISILGIDLQYVEVIDEAKSTEGIKLEMVSTPSSNPNYFFDDYQRAGDKYNIPNPDAHDGNLHVKSFEVMVNDIKQFNWNVKVSNSNLSSILEYNKILPFKPLNEFNSDSSNFCNRKKDKIKKIFVAGNGPSLKDINFDNLKNIDWLGMNAAYRYWDEIGIYPTYYCCLDKVVVQEHATEIKRLLDNKSVRSAFLIKAVLEVEPDLEEYSNVYFLEDLVISDSDNARIFRTAFSSKKTTGSWAVRFTIFLGYTDVFISGIDCNYVEIVSGAKLTGNELELQIDDDSADNPNYFFKGYQKKGDKYQIPNPESHFGNMHLQSLEAVAIDVIRDYPNVKISNTAKDSNLYKYNVFPYLSVRRLFGRSALDAIVIPMIRQEVDTLLSNFELWTDRGFQPVTLPNNNSSGVYLHIVLDCKNDEEIVARVEQDYSKNHYLQAVFAGLRITFLNIPSNLNHYIRDSNDTSRIRKSGPNVHALATFQCLANTYNTIFYMEVDNTPVQQGWLDILSAYCFDNTFLIAGAVLNDIGNVDPALSLHINGNALYRIGNKQFASLLSEIFYPGIQYLICKRGNNHIAYDCLISAVLSLTLSARHRRDLGEPISPEVRELSEKLQPYLSLLTPFPALVNIPPGTEGNLYQLMQRYLIKNSGALIVHNKIFNDEVNNMRMQLFSNEKFYDNEIFNSKFRNSHFNLVSNNQLLPFHYFNTREGLDADYIDYARGLLVIRGNDLNCETNEMLTKGLSIVLDSSRHIKNTQLRGFLEIKTSDDVDIEFRLARHGEGEFCQAYKKVKALKGIPQEIELPLVIKENYKALRLAVSPHNSFERMTVRFRVVKDQNPMLNGATDTVFNIKDNSVASAIEMFEKIELAHKNESNTKPANQINLPELELRLTENPELSKTDEVSSHPKVLVIDATLIGSGSATGQIKSLFFRNWPKDKVMQVFVHGQNLRATYPLKSDKNNKIFTENYITKQIDEFGPDVVYFRPTDDHKLFSIVDYALSKGVALVTHMMDDWPTRLYKSDRNLAKRLDERLRHYFKFAHKNFSICEQMSKVYQARYEVSFTALANGVNIDSISPKNWDERPPLTRQNPIRICYMGGVAEDMNYSSVVRFAAVVEELAKSKPVVFEVFTMAWYQEKLKRDLKDFKSTSVCDLVPLESYYQCLSGADGLLIAYNFDEKTIDYVGLSFANKLPEVLASGVPGLFIGHASIPTINYLKKEFPQLTLTNNTSFESDVKKLITSLYFEDSKQRMEISRFARELASEKFKDVDRTDLFKRAIEQASSSGINVDSENMVELLKNANNALHKKKYREAFMMYCSLNRLSSGRFSFWTRYCLRKID
jgi:hypothetical protein